MPYENIKWGTKHVLAVVHFTTRRFETVNFESFNNNITYVI